MTCVAGSCGAVRGDTSVYPANNQNQSTSFSLILPPLTLRPPPPPTLPQLDAEEDFKREQAKVQEHLEAQLRKAEEALKREKAALDSELTATAAEMGEVEVGIEEARLGLAATTESVKDLEPSVQERLIEE